MNPGLHGALCWVRLEMKSIKDTDIDADCLLSLAGDWGSRHGLTPVRVEPLAGAGSSRRYFRIYLSASDDDNIFEKTLIGTVGDSARENRAFVALSRLFVRSGLPAPDVVAVADDCRCYLQQDLGDLSLFSMLGREDGERAALEALSELPRFQTLPEREWADMVFNNPFGSREVINDLHYFKHCFLKPLGVEADDMQLEREFDDIAAAVDAIPAECCGLMLRDFQSRNVMVHEGRPFIIDFQGARRGPLLYDAISFLWQAKAGFSPEFRRSGLEVFARGVADNSLAVDCRELLAAAPLIALVRTLQVLGAYGLRGVIEKKAHFLQSIPQGIGNLTLLLRDAVASGCTVDWTEAPSRRWPELCRIAGLLSRLPIVRELSAADASRDWLRVSLFSFSYKKGYPLDFSGNGGGFMFDCRGLHNPGRYAEYRSLTGMDREVIDFLDGYEEVGKFVRNALDMVVPSVRRYAQRGFTSLQIGFGCTGGQHRSVYCAEHVARAIAEAFPDVEVDVCHREQGVSYRLNPHVPPFKAMILAAGLGTRLRPWTLEHPKALVPVGGVPMFYRVAERLLGEGCRRIGVNVCHFADQLVDYCEGKDMTGLLERYGATLCVSDETDNLLETGGGIVKMAPLLDPEGEGFLVHNVDILSNARLNMLMRLHRAYNPDGVTLLVSDRKSSRKLTFDCDGQLAGWRNLKDGSVRNVNPHRGPRISPDADVYCGLAVAQGELAFSGIYVVGGKAAAEMGSLRGSAPFAVMDYFLDPERRCRIMGFAQPDLELLDIGKPDALAKADVWVVGNQ